MIALLAKRQSAVPRTLARVSDPDNAWLFDIRWGVDVALPADTVVAAVVHDAHPIVPTSDYRFHTGDTVLVLTTTATENEINEAFP